MTDSSRSEQKREPTLACLSVLVTLLKASLGPWRIFRRHGSLQAKGN